MAISDLDARVASLREEANRLEALKKSAPPRGTIVVHPHGLGVSSGDVDPQGNLILLIPESQGVWVNSGHTAEIWRLAEWGKDLVVNEGDGRVLAQPLEGERL